MKYSIEAVRKHPAYKHGFEGHRALWLARREYETSNPPGVFCTTPPAEWSFANGNGLVFEDHALTFAGIWLAGAHAGMQNCNRSVWSEGVSNWEPIYDEQKQQQLRLF